MSSDSHSIRFATTEENYGSAARRHLHDAQALLGQGRTDNAAYLAGYVLECSLKKLLEMHGYGAREYGHDLQRMSGQALSLAAILSPCAGRYRIDDIDGFADAVAFWRPSQRYFPTGAVVNGERMVALASHVYERILLEAILDGNGALHP